MSSPPHATAPLEHGRQSRSLASWILAEKRGSGSITTAATAATAVAGVQQFWWHDDDDDASDASCVDDEDW